MYWTELLDKLEQLIREFGSRAAVDHKETILSWLSLYQSCDVDFKPFVFYDKSGYTKNLVRSIGNQANVIVMCWSPGQSSAFHAHEGSRCFVKVLSGQLTEQQVAYPSESGETIISNNNNKRSLIKNDVTYIDDLIGAHRMVNEHDAEPAITLHVYLPPYKKCRIFEPLEPFDKDQNSLSMKQSKSVDVDFFSEPN